MRRPATLSNIENQILDRLAEVNYSTSKQLVRWLNVQASHISQCIKKLVALNLVDGNFITRPMILHLTQAAGRLLNVPQPYDRRHASWSVMAHACHLNEVQALMLEKHAGFRFLSRETLYKQGFNPGFGEHCAVDDSGTTWFVILDDYLMGSDRIKRSWTRRHTPNTKYWPDHTGRAWCEVVNRFVVICTDESHALKHQKYITMAGLPAEVIQIKPLWRN